LFLAGVLSLIAVDLLRAVGARAQAQAAADAAALAAAQEMVLGDEVDPSALAAEYAVRNGAELVWCVCPVAGTEATVEVSVTFSTVVLGGDRVTTAQARAVVETGGLRSPPPPPGTVGRGVPLSSDGSDRSAQIGVDG
jgi:Flp pilus assembly protein TadG